MNYDGQYNGKQKMKVAKIHRNKHPKSKRVAPRRTHSRNQLTSTSSNGHSRGKSFEFICTIVNDVKLRTAKMYVFIILLPIFL